ncbi:MAG: diguanylate cyclase [Planctomycetes bacterium]|nr:diguanylate cyclase [Planctomycetota bacterium]
MHRHVAERLLRESFGYRDGESFVVVAEPEGAKLAEQLAAAARDLGFPSSLLVIPRRASPDFEPPDFVLEALRAADIALFLAPRSLAASRAFRTAAETGLRIGEITELAPDAFWRLLEAPAAMISSRASALSGALEPGRRIRIRTPGGCDFEFVAAADREVRDGVISGKGEIGRLPGGLVRILVQPGTLKGRLLVDAWSPLAEAASRRAELEFENGTLKTVSDAALRKALSAGGGLAALPAEAVGFGLNAAARLGRSPLESVIAPGTVSLSLGLAPEPLDFVALAPAIEVEGMPVPADILVAPPLPPAPTNDLSPETAAAQPQPNPFGPDVFRTLFEHSNDAQYILDFEAQKIVMVNDAFLRLTGYARSDVSAGRLRVGDLVAEESHDRVEEKRAQRRNVPSERYDLRIRCADQSKKVVEVSVQRVKLQGHDFILGSLRDLTTHERMKRDLTERATDAMRKTLEIYALTEKIKNVPKLTPALLASDEEDEILAKAAKILMQKPGLSLAAATIYLIEEHHLVQRFPVPTAKSGPSRFDLSKGHRLARIARGEETQIDFTTHDIALPLPGREGVIGVLEVALDPKETDVMVSQAGGQVRTEYQNLLVSLAQILALSIENNRLYKVVKEQSETDQLTGIYNRRIFDKRLGDEVKRARRYGRELALLMIDLDHFKSVNDTYGHPKGDETLRHVARFLRVQSRGVDILARYGGDEFCLLLPECTLDNAMQKAELLRKRFVTRKFSVVGRGAKAVRLTLSIGVGALTDDMATEFDLLRIADNALYRAKGQGRNRVCQAQELPQGASENSA